MILSYHLQPPDKKGNRKRLPVNVTVRPVKSKNRYPKAHTYGPRRREAMFAAWQAKQLELAKLAKKRNKNKAHGLGKVLAFAVPNAFAKTNEEDKINTIPQTPKKQDVTAAKLVWPLRNIYTRMDELRA